LIGSVPVADEIAPAVHVYDGAETAVTLVG
jgi:hypothetical protein